MSDPVTAAAVAVLLASGPAVTDPLVLQALSETRAECGEQESDRLIYDDGFVTEVDLTGDGTLDRIVHEAGALCLPGGGYMHAGSGGAPVHAIIGNHVQTLENGAWTVTDVAFTVDGEALPPQRILLQAVHGTACDSFGAAPCLIAYAWDGERLISVLDGLVWTNDEDEEQE